MARRARPTPTTRDVDIPDVANRLHSAAIHLLRRARRVDALTNIPAPQLSALSVIVYGGPITLGALAAAEQVRPPTMTRLVASMEAAGLVIRKSDETDGRIARVEATARGRRILEEGRDRRIAAIADELRGLDEKEVRAIVAALDAIEIVAGRPNPRAARD